MDIALALWDIREMSVKLVNGPDSGGQACDAICEINSKITEILDKHGINLDELIC